MCEFPTDQVLAYNGWFRDARTGNWYKQNGDQLVFEGGWRYIPLVGKKKSIAGGLKGAISELKMQQPPTATQSRKRL